MMEGRLPPLVAMPPPSDSLVYASGGGGVGHPGWDGRGTTRTRSGTVFEAQPAAVHFAGFKLGERCTQIVNVVNTSSEPRRLLLLGLRSDAAARRTRGSDRGPFSVRCDRRGSIPPGCSEIITVEFVGGEHAIYEDEVRLQTEVGILLVHLYAFPAMPAEFLPKRIDLGACEVGRTSRRIFDLTAAVGGLVPELRFEIEALPPECDLIRVSPLSGTLGGSAPAPRVVVEFSPQRAVTYVQSFLIRVSQVHFAPYQCTIVANGCVVKSHKGSRAAAECPTGGAAPARDRSAKLLLAAPSSSPPSMPPFLSEGGLLIPPNLESTHAVNFILNQEPGKVKSHEGRLSGGLPLHVKERAFLKELAELEQRGGEFIGQNLMTEEDVALVRRGRDEAKTADEAEVAKNARARTWTVLSDPRVSREARRAATILVAFGQNALPGVGGDENVWARRQFVLQRFVHAVSKVILRERAARRLQAIWAGLESTKQPMLCGRKRARRIVTLGLVSLKEFDTAASGAPFDWPAFLSLSVAPPSPSLFTATAAEAVPVPPLPPVSFRDLHSFEQTSGGAEEVAWSHGALLGEELPPPPHLKVLELPGLRIPREGAFEEYGTRQARDLLPGWQNELITTEREEGTASLKRRRSSVGLRLQDKGKWPALASADARLSNLAETVEKGAEFCIDTLCPLSGQVNFYQLLHHVPAVARGPRLPSGWRSMTPPCSPPQIALFQLPSAPPLAERWRVSLQALFDEEDGKEAPVGSLTDSDSDDDDDDEGGGGESAAASSMWEECHRLARPTLHFPRDAARAEIGRELRTERINRLLELPKRLKDIAEQLHSLDCALPIQEVLQPVSS
jgi:hypothetical protein